MAIRNIFFRTSYDGKELSAGLTQSATEFDKAGQSADKYTRNILESEEATRKADQQNRKLSTTLRKEQRDVNSVSNQFRRFTKDVTQNDRAANSLNSTLQKVGITFGAIQALNYSKEAAKIAAESEGIVRAFERLPGSVQILEQLKEATRGTVQEVRLMEAAVRASQFGLPIEELAGLFAFAKQRADDTGDSVEVLVDKIVRGIGRKSVLILDDLGLSATQLKDALGGATLEASSLEDITRAVGSIASEELAKVGDVADTNNNRLQRLQVGLENIRQEFGRLVLKIIGEYEPGVTSASEATLNFLKNLNVKNVQLLIKGLIKLGTAWIALKTAQAAVRVGLVAYNAIAVGARAVTLLLSASYNVLTGNATRAAAAMRLLNTTVLSNPFGLLISSLIILFPLLYRFISGTEDANENVQELALSQKQLVGIQEEYNKNLTKELASLRSSLQLLKQTNAGSSERKRLIEDINSEYGTTLQNMEDEEAFARQIADAYDVATEAIKRKVAEQVKESRLQPLIERELQVREQLTEQGFLNPEDIKDFDNLRVALDGANESYEEIIAGTLSYSNESGKSAQKVATLRKELLELLSAQQKILDTNFFGNTQQQKPTGGTKEESDIVAGSIASIKARINALQKVRQQQIKLVANGQLNLEAFRKNAELIAKEEQRLQDALEKISPVEPYKAADASIKEIEKEILSIQEAIEETQKRGFLTEDLQEQLDKANARLKKSQEDIKKAKALNDLALEEEEIRHQQELIEIAGQYNGEYIKKEEDRNAKIIDLEIELLKKRLEYRKLAGELSEVEETRIQNRIEELKLKKQEETQDKQLKSLKDYTEAFSKLELDARVDLVRQVADEVFRLGETLINIQIAQLDKLMSLQQQRVSEATELAKEGNVALLEAEKDRLDELNRQREQFVRRQQALAALEVAANSAVAIAKAAAEGGVAAPFTIAATLVALAAGLAQARSLASMAAFKDGVIDFKGKGSTTSDSNIVRLSNRESVIKAESSMKSKGLLTAINDGRLTDASFASLMPGRKIDLVKDETRGGRQPTPRELREIVALMKKNKTSETNITPRAMVKVVETGSRKRRRIRTRL